MLAKLPYQPQGNTLNSPSSLYSCDVDVKEFPSILVHNLEVAYRGLDHC